MRRGRTVALVTVVMLTACGHASPAALPDIDALHCANTALPSQPSSLPALAALSSLEHAPITGRIVHGGHGNAGAEPPLATQGAERVALGQQLRAAAQAACALRTPDDARRAGYALSSVYTEGVGTHWTNWRLVDAPFDPARPSMLLYGPRFGTTQLVGFSYWTRAPAPPAGFAGTDDHWHQHFGLCFDAAGMLEREDVRNAGACDGHWLNGGDIWMLHAWVVPGDANVWGVFAPLNPVLCRRNVPDILRCPGFD